MAKIRFLQVVTVMNRGGLETMLMNYYRNIDRTRFQFDFLVHREERGAYDDEIEAMGGKIYRLPALHPKNFMRYKKCLDEFFSQHLEYKVVHAHLDTLSTWILHVAKKHGVPVRIAHSHNTSYDLDAKAILRECSRLFLNSQCTHRLACSEKAGRWLFGSKYSRKITILHNAVEAKKFSYKETLKKSCRKKLNLQDEFVIGHIGRFNKQKNHKFLLDVFHKLHASQENAVLLLVGQGNLEQSIRKYAARLGLGDSVRFLGLRSDVQELLQSFDVFLFPSLFEGLPVALIEAQAAGLPCIVADTVSEEVEITDLVEFISLSKPPEYWAEQIVKYRTGFQRRDMGAELKESGYDIAENTKWLENFYLAQYRLAE